MNNSIYGKGVKYNATTIKASGVAKQLLSPIKIRTPDVYEEKREETVIALWDTGATGSCISKCFAEKLGLKPSDFQNSFGVNGLHRVPAYDIIIDLNQYVRNIHLVVAEANLNKVDGGPPNSEIGFLLGMDVICKGDFFTGQFKDKDGVRKSMFSFRLPTALSPTDYLKEIQDYNRIVEEQNRKQQQMQFIRKKTGKRKK